MKNNVSDLEIMPVCCKTCPFKLNKNDVFQDVVLASKVTERTLFKSQQLCHKDSYDKKKQLFRCRGSYDYNKEIYTRMKLDHLLK